MPPAVLTLVAQSQLIPLTPWKSPKAERREKWGLVRYVDVSQKWVTATVGPFRVNPKSSSKKKPSQQGEPQAVCLTIQIL